jgi:hypothetical protein
MLLSVCHVKQVSELPTAQMYAKLHERQQQQQPGSRAHVVEQQQQKQQQQEQQQQQQPGSEGAVDAEQAEPHAVVAAGALQQPVNPAVGDPACEAA